MMLHHKSNPNFPSLLFVVPLFYLPIISATFFSLSHGDSYNHHLIKFNHHHHDHLQGLRRIVLEESPEKNSAEENGRVMILAANKTYRKDPSNNFNYYTGGWDITDSHYIFSVAYTAAPLVITAIVWFVVVGLFLLCACLCCCCCCCRQKHANYSRTTYLICLVFLLLLTISAIVGTGILYSGQWRFYKSVEGTFGYLVQQARDIFNNIQNLWGVLVSAKDMKIGGITLLPTEIQDTITHLNSIVHQVSKFPLLSSQHSSQIFYQAMSPPRRVLNILAAVMLILTLVGLLFSVLGMRVLVYILAIIGWILVTVTFLLCAVFLLFHNVVADTCVAMHEWVENPTANSSLSQFLPCIDNESAGEILNVTKVVSYLVVEVTNSYNTNVTNQNFPPDAAPLYYNQSGPPLPLLCNPIDENFNSRDCAPGEIDLSNATQVWKDYTCQVSETGICVSEGRLTPDMYTQLTGAVNVSHVLENYTPFLISLVDCSFVRETFRDISVEHCPGLTNTSKLIYVGLLSLSCAVMLSLIFWLFYVRESRQRVYAKEAMNASFLGTPRM